MADKPTPAGKTEHPDLANLRERETIFVQKLTDLDKLDGNEQLRGRVDIQEVKRRTQERLTEIRAAIQRLLK